MPICGRSAYTDASGPVTKLKSGSKVTFEVEVTAHHKGHFQFRLCDKTINSGVDGNACFDKFPLQRVRPSEIHSDCAVNDKRGDCQPYYDDLADLWFLPESPGEYNADQNFNDGDAPPTTGSNSWGNLLQEGANSTAKSGRYSKGRYYMTFWIPADFKCDMCTLQFWYRTANSTAKSGRYSKGRYYMTFW